MKVLLIAAGRRYSFVERLTDAGFNSVYSIEYDTHSPISKIDNVTILESKSHCQDKKFIIEYGEIVDIIIHLNDFWSENLHYIKCKAPFATSESNKICHNKKLFEDFMIDRFPQFYPSKKLFNKGFIKPIYGNGSKGIRKVNWYSRPNKDEIKQRFISGKEYSVDAYFSKNGDYINSITRSRDRVAGGEVIDSTIEDGKKSSLLNSITKTVGEELGLSGPTCFQFFIDDKNNPYLFEINARFGGGCILSLESGFDMIRLLISEYINNIDISNWKNIKFNRLKMKRVNRETFFEY